MLLNFVSLLGLLGLNFVLCDNMTELSTDQQQVYEMGNTCDPTFLLKEFCICLLGFLILLAAVIGASKVVCCDKESSEAEYTREADGL